VLLLVVQLLSLSCWSKSAAQIGKAPRIRFLVCEGTSCDWLSYRWIGKEKGAIAVKPIVVKGMSIGEGMPKTIVSLMDGNIESLLASAERGKAAGADCFEWRVDFFSEVHNTAAVVSAARSLSEVLPENPLLFTFRSESQGGNATLDLDEYVALNSAVIGSGAIDMVDIEIGIGDNRVRDFAVISCFNDVVPVVSYHDFEKTPTHQDLVALLERMMRLGAGIPKVAVMAHDAHDALVLLSAAEEFKRTFERPALTMAMGAQGSITRLVGEQFGSALTFCSLDSASAPGQVPVQDAKRIMSDLHALIS